MNCRHYILCFTLLLAIAGCKSYSRYSIDPEPVIRTKPSFYGIWRCEEYNKKRHSVIVQNFDDAMWHTTEKYLSRSYQATKKPPFFNDSYVEEIRDYKNDGFEYWITVNNQNDQYLQWGVFPSEIGDVTFLNCTYNNTEYKNNKVVVNEKGYFFLRIISASDDEITTALVADPTLKYLKSSKEVRQRIIKRMDQKTFYSDTLHFYKISDYHRDINKAIQFANDWQER